MLKYILSSVLFRRCFGATQNICYSRLLKIYYGLLPRCRVGSKALGVIAPESCYGNENEKGFRGYGPGVPLCTTNEEFCCLPIGPKDRNLLNEKMYIIDEY